MQRRTLALSVRLGIAVVLGCVPALAQYQLKNLVSNQIGAATHTDPADRERMGACSRLAASTSCGESSSAAAPPTMAARINSSLPPGRATIWPERLG